jgi:O-antigen ligase
VQALIALGALGALALLVGIVRDPRVGIVVGVMALSLDIYGRVWADPPLTVYQVVLVVTLAAWLWRLARGEAPRGPRTHTDLWILALVGAGLWSLPFSLDAPATAYAVVRLVFIYLFFRLVSAYAGDPAFVRMTVAALLVAAAFSSGLAYLQHTVPGFDIGNVSVTLGPGVAPIIRGSAFFDDPNYLGAMLSAAAIAGLMLGFSAPTVARALPWLAGSLACMPGLYATLSRTAWVGTAAGVLAMIALSPPRRRRYLAGFVAAAAIAIVVLQPSALVERAGSMLDSGGDGSIATRLNMYVSTAEMIRDNWAVGVGLGAFSKAYPAYRRFGAMIDITRPHQIPLTVWAEMGVAGLLAELGLTASVVLAVRRRARGPLALEARVGVACLVALLVQTLFQNLLYVEYLWLFLAITIVALGRSPRGEEVA